MIGEGVLITPVVEEGATAVRGYFPSTSKWYSLVDGEPLSSSDPWVELLTPLDALQVSSISPYQLDCWVVVLHVCPIDPQVHVRGGTIIPLQHPQGALTTSDARHNPYHLLVALDFQQSARGDLFYDDGEEPHVTNFNLLHFVSTESTLSSYLVANYYESAHKQWIEKVVVWGVAGTGNSTDRRVLVGYELWPEEDWEYDSSKGILAISRLRCYLDEEFDIRWKL